MPRIKEKLYTLRKELQGIRQEIRRTVDPRFQSFEGAPPEVQTMVQGEVVRAMIQTLEWVSEEEPNMFGGEKKKARKLDGPEFLTGLGEVLALMKERNEITAKIEARMREIGQGLGVDFDEAQRMLKLQESLHHGK